MVSPTRAAILSKRALFSGVPSHVGMIRQSLNSPTFVGELTRRFAQSATDEIRELAFLDRDWAPYADRISAVVRDGEIVFQFEGTEAELDAINNLELGDPVTGAPPSPLFRKMGYDVRALSRRLSEDLERTVYRD